MKKRKPPQMFRMRVYKARPPLRQAFRIFGVILLAVFIAAVILFIILWHYAVYLPDGSVEIRLPWGTI